MKAIERKWYEGVITTMWYAAADHQGKRRSMTFRIPVEGTKGQYESMETGIKFDYHKFYEVCQDLDDEGCLWYHRVFEKCTEFSCALYVEIACTEQEIQMPQRFKGIKWPGVNEIEG